MKRFFALSLMAALFCFSHQHAMASADDICEARWNLLTTQPYCVNWAFLNPGNDTRLNLQMLRVDRGFGTLPAAISTTSPPAWGRSQPAPGKLQAEPFSSDEFVLAMAPADEPDSGKTDTAGLEKLVKTLGFSDVTVGSGIDFEKGEGSRCLSNSTKSAAAFLEQVAATSLTSAEKTALAQNRLTMLGRCNFGASDIAEFGSISGGSPFARYLQAAAQFYSGDFDDAEKSFRSLTAADHPWLKETALYMVARTALNKAQANIAKDYGLIDMDAVDKTAAADAGTGLDAYLKAYPQGLYANSATGLRRKVAWLLGDRIKLANAFSNALATPGTAILQEADNKLLIDLAHSDLDIAKLNDITDPDLLAVIDLMKMREGMGQITRANLEGQRPNFAKRPELYRFLDGAFAFYAEKDWTRTLAVLSPTLPPTPTYLAFSEAVLRGLALEAKGDGDGARKLWLDLLAKAHQPLQPAVVELAVARNYERAGQTDLLFAKAAPQTSSEIRQTLLSTVAGAPLLRQVARTGVSTEERTAAIRTLLYEDLFQRKFADFGTDFTLIPSDVPSAVPADPLGYAIFRLNVPPETLALFRWTGNSASSEYTCPSLAETAGVLAHNEQSSKGLICLGEFILHNRLDGYDPARVVSDGDLGSGASQFSGEHYSRLTGYMQVMADTKAPQGDQAYALYRAIRCFAPTGSNGCGLQDIEKDQRKAWFHELKTKFKDTKWANELRYYW